jgi:DNA alkylation repair enzyme
MPAIHPARLKQQASDLASRFGEPATFVRHLHLLLDRYTDHTHRKGQPGEISALLSAYKAPPQVMRQLWIELQPFIRDHPDQVLALCDALWSEPNVDMRMLSAHLLGSLPVEQSEMVVKRLKLWVGEGLEQRMLDGLLDLGLAGMKRAAPTMLLDLISAWMASPEISDRQAGLRALLVLVDKPIGEYLPSIFRILTPFIRIAPPRLRPDILAVIATIAQSSPSEMAYVLHQNLTTPDNPDTAWVIRQVLLEFPKDVRQGLRQALKNHT